MRAVGPGGVSQSTHLKGKHVCVPTSDPVRVAEMAPDPVWLGSFVRCTLEHPDLFQYNCPDCGKVVHPYRYVGSPLSGVVHLEGRCDCGWNGINEVSGWRLRATTLRDQLKSDKLRYRKYRLLHPRAYASTMAELILKLSLARGSVPYGL